jgi:diaminobutyrate-2-oxoglutarate transaminase
VGLAQGLRFTEPVHAAKVCAGAFDRGLLLETSGPADEVVKLMPPLTITDTELDEGLAIVAECVRAAR